MIKESQFEELNPAEELRQFQEEIAALKVIELEKKEEGKYHDPHFERIEPALLDQRDSEIYEKYKNKTLEREEYENWRRDINKERETQRPETDPLEDPRTNFYAWLGNQISTKEWLKIWSENKK